MGEISSPLWANDANRLSQLKALERCWPEHPYITLMIMLSSHTTINSNPLSFCSTSQVPSGNTPRISPKNKEVGGQGGLCPNVHLEAPNLFFYKQCTQVCLQQQGRSQRTKLLPNNFKNKRFWEVFNGKEASLHLIPQASLLWAAFSQWKNSVWKKVGRKQLHLQAKVQRGDCIQSPLALVSSESIWHKEALFILGNFWNDRHDQQTLCHLCIFVPQASTWVSVEEELIVQLSNAHKHNNYSELPPNACSKNSKLLHNPFVQVGTWNTKAWNIILLPASKKFANFLYNPIFKMETFKESCIFLASLFLEAFFYVPVPLMCMYGNSHTQLTEGEGTRREKQFEVIVQVHILWTCF